MRQEFGRTVESSFSPLSDSHPKLLGVPIDDDGGQQVQTRDAEVLTFSGAIADFALPPDFAHRKCQVVLSRSRRQFLEEMTGLHPAGEHGCNAAQNIWPIGDDGGFADAVARQALQFFWDSLRVKDMQPLGGEVADAGVEQIAKQ